MEFIIEHSRIGHDLPDFVSLGILVAVAVFYIVRTRKMKNEEKELVDKIEELQSNGSTENSQI